MHMGKFIMSTFHQTSSRRMRWVGHAAVVGQMRIAYKILGGKSEEKIRDETRRLEETSHKFEAVLKRTIKK